MTTDISTTFLGIPCPNLFFLASAPPTQGYAKIASAFDAGWGGVVTKTIGVDEVNNVKGQVTIFIRLDLKTGRMTTKGKGPVIASWNWELISDKDLKWWLPELTRINRDFSRQVLIASIMAGTGRKELKKWRLLAKSCEDAGAKALEMNVSCPHFNKPGMGSDLGENPRSLEQAVSAVKSSVCIPVLVKLVSSTHNIAVQARAAAQGGADAISSSNTFSALPWFDTKSPNLDPIINVNGLVASGGYGGPIILPLSLQKMRQLAQAKIPNLKFSGIGGISTFDDALQHMLLGAGMVQVGTAAMIDHGYGPNVIRELKSGLRAFLKARAHQGFNSVASIVGARIDRVVPHDNIERPKKKMPASGSEVEEPRFAG